MLSTHGHKAKMTILDAGCGSGGMLRALKLEHEVLGIDAAHDALAAGLRAGAQGLARARIELLPLRDECLDAVVSVDALCHESCDEPGALREIRRVLRPGGVLLVNLPAYEWLKGPHDLAVRNRRRYAAHEVRSMLVAGGFLVRRITYRNTLLFPIACAVRLMERLILGQRGRSDVGLLPRWLDEMLFALLFLEARLLKRVSSPFGLSVFAVAIKPTEKEPVETRHH
jgi:SAM-dependent methyltransferase